MNLIRLQQMFNLFFICSAFSNKTILWHWECLLATTTVIISNTYRVELMQIHSKKKWIALKSYHFSIWALVQFSKSIVLVIYITGYGKAECIYIQYWIYNKYIEIQYTVYIVVASWIESKILANRYCGHFFVLYTFSTFHLIFKMKRFNQ